jgi:hypothetical protein
MNKREITKLRKGYLGTANSLAKDVAKRLNEKGVVTTYKKTFNEYGVKMVLNGTYQNKDVESEISIIIEEQKLAKQNAQ